MATAEGTRELQQVDPRNLQLENNVRAEASLTKDFLASIKELGVLMPVIAVRNLDGTLLVRAGQRRTAAAREVGLTSIPVYITDEGTDDATRLVTQIVENDQRLGLEADDRALGIQALIDTGMSVTKVAKRLSMPAAQVKKSSTVASSKAALEALQKESLTLDQAAELAEFEDDPAAVAALIEASKRRFFDHELARQKSDRVYRQKLGEASEPYIQRGMTVVQSRPAYGDTEMVSEDFLVDADGNDVGREAVLASVEANPQAWAVFLDEEAIFTNAEGETIPETQIDWATEADPEAEPEEGLVHADTVQETIVFVPGEFYCLDPAAVGMALSDRFLRMQAQGGTVVTPTIAEREAEKRERRKVLALNKAGDAAQGVRRAFITGLLQRKTLPKGAMTFIAKMLTTDPSLLAGYTASATAAELLGVAGDELASSAADASEARAEIITLGLVLGALEVRAPKGAWRAPSAHTVGPKEYLNFLSDCGYELSPVEQVMNGTKTADEVMEEHHHE